MARLKGFVLVSWMLQASSCRSGKKQQESSSENLEHQLEPISVVLNRTSLTHCSCSYQWTFFIKDGLQTFPSSWKKLRRASQSVERGLLCIRGRMVSILGNFSLRLSSSRVAEIGNGRKLWPISPMCSTARPSLFQSRKMAARIKDSWVKEG